MAKILIAEDERDIRDLVIFTLTFGGHEVVAAGNGAELVDLAPKEQPDIILSDVRMPKMTGYEACVSLKANPTTKDIPIVFLSAKGQEEEVSQGMAAGATAYILKPFAPDVLLNKVKEVLAKHPRAKDAGAAKPAPDAGAAKPMPDAGAAKPAPDAGAAKPMPDAGGAKPAPDAGAAKPAPDAGATKPAPGNMDTKKE